MKRCASKRCASCFRTILIICRAWFVLALHLSPLTGNARTQDLDNVTISGRITDANGAAIPGALLRAVHIFAAGVERTATADEEGRYRLIQLAPGAYTLQVSFTNFAVAERTNVAALGGQNIQLDWTLVPANVTAEQVIVSEEDVPAVDTTRTVVGGTVTGEEIEHLPVPTRQPLDLVFTLGGVTEEPLSTRDVAEDRNRPGAGTTPEEAGIFALSGSPAYSNNITIDGLDNNDDRAARERFQPSIEAIEEVQVITNQFSAEYGRASGGRVNLRTRRGTKSFRGRLFYFFRDEALNANTWRNNSLGLSRLPLQQHNPGFTLSGPVILPTKLFGPMAYRGMGRTGFFAAYERDTVLDSTLIDTLVLVQSNPLFPLPLPTTLAGRRTEDGAASATANQPAELAPFIERVSTPGKNSSFTLRVDHKFTDAHSGTSLYQRGRNRNLRQFGGGSRLADTLLGRTRNTDALSYSDTYVLSATLINGLRLQVSRLTPAVKAAGGENPQTRPVVLINIDDPLTAEDSFNRSGTLVAGSSTLGSSDRRELRFQIQDAFSVLLGAHAFKFGADVHHIRSTFIDLSDATGTFNFASAGDFLANTPSRFRQNFLTDSAQQNSYTSFFVQDEWQLRANLRVNYGMRYEHETILRRDRNNWAPRFGLAYDPWRSGRTVIRAGAGIFYNRVLLRTIDDFTLGQRRLFFDTDTLRDPASGRLLTPAERQSFINRNISFPQALTADAPLVREFAVTDNSFQRRLDPDLRIPESYQLNVGIEREVGRGIVIEANYTRNRTAHLWREFNQNAPVLPAGSYKDLTEYLLSRDFVNFRGGSGARPLYNAASAGELVRFRLTPFNAANIETVGRTVEYGVPISHINLNSFTASGTAYDAAQAVLNGLRPDPTRGEVEQLASIGNSFYHGLTIETRRRFARRGNNNFSFSLRAAYTLSSLIDDGIVNTSNALVAGDFRQERARSLLDRRHRFVFSGVFDTPRWLGKLRFAPILRLASAAPFNISLGGADRNLDDVGNDRPIFTGDRSLLRARRPGERLANATDATDLLNSFALPAIGQSSTLPRNAGQGFGLFLFDVNITREFRFGERLRLRPTVEIDNLLNKTVYTFGAEFINFNAVRPTATEQQRQAALDSLLVPTRTLRPRSIRLGMRFDF